MTSTTENPPAPDADPRGGEREKLAAEFEVLAEKATQGEVEADPDDRSGMEWNWHVVHGNDRLCFMSNGPRSEANAAFIAWCFNHRADIRAALRPQPNVGVLTDSARAQAAAEEIASMNLIPPKSGDEGWPLYCADVANIAAIIAKHLGAGAGLTLTESERRDFRWALDEMKYNGRTAIAGRLEGLYLRLTPGEANHG